jgi:hypothetical protein
MKKAANTQIPLSPEEAYLASRLFGGSLFSAIQMSKEMERMKQMEKAQNGDQVLSIPLPMNKLKVASDEVEPGIIGRALRFNRSPIRFMVGAEHGFDEARSAYQQAEKAEIQRQLQLAQQEYLHTLEQIKAGEETPCVDAFCAGMASEVALADVHEKTAEDEIADGSIRRLLGDILGVAKKPVQPVLDVGATGLLGTAAGSGYLTYLLKKHMRGDAGKPQDGVEPTRVELVPV